MPLATGKRCQTDDRDKPPVSRNLFRARWYVVAAVLVLAPLRSAFAQGDTLYGALILATNTDDDHPAPVPQEIRGQAKALEDVFGYNEFHVIGQKHKALTTGTEDWLVSGHRFFLKIDTKHPVPDGYALGLQLWKEKQVLVEADVKLSKERPFFIRGPFVAQGQLIILLMVQDPPAIEAATRK